MKRFNFIPHSRKIQFLLASLGAQCFSVAFSLNEKQFPRYDIPFHWKMVSDSQKVRADTCGGRIQVRYPVPALGQIKFVPNSAVSVP